MCSAHCAHNVDNPVYVHTTLTTLHKMCTQRWTSQKCNCSPSLSCPVPHVHKCVCVCVCVCVHIHRVDTESCTLQSARLTDAVVVEPWNLTCDRTHISRTSSNRVVLSLSLSCPSLSSSTLYITWRVIRGWLNCEPGQSYFPAFSTTNYLILWIMNYDQNKTQLRIRNSVLIFTQSLAEWSAHIVLLRMSAYLCMIHSSHREGKNVFVSRQIKEIRGAYECSCWPKAWSGTKFSRWCPRSVMLEEEVDIEQTQYKYKQIQIMIQIQIQIQNAE